MTDEIDRLARALRESPPPPPDPARRARSLDAARAAFEAASAGVADGAAGENPGTAQERGARWRLRGIRALWPGLVSGRRDMERTGRMRPGAGLMAGASLATVALALVVAANLGGGPGELKLGGETPSPAGMPREADEARHMAEAVPDTAAVEREAVAASEMPAPPPVPMAEPAPAARRDVAPLAALSSRPEVSATAGAAAPRAPAGRALGLLADAPADALPAPGFREQGRDSFPEIEDNPVRVTAEHPVSTFSIDADTASYAFVRRALMEGVLPPPDAVRVEEMINYFAYDYPAPETPEPPFAVHPALMQTPWNPDTLLLRIGVKGHEIVAAERPRANLVFLIDTSGSMNAPDKLPLLVNAFRLLLERLGPEDRVAIVAYAGAAGTVLEPTPASARAEILGALERLSAGGSTSGGEGIRQAYALAESAFEKGGVNRVILATDGDFNVGIRDAGELEGFVARKRESGVHLSVLGFGRGNYNDRLMQAIAQAGNGQAAYIDTLAEARKVLVEEAASTLFPIAADVKIQVEFNPATVAEYRLIGYETRALAREDFNNDRVDAGEIGSGHRVTALYELTPAGSGARLVDDLRYAPAASGGGEAAEAAGEFGFLRMRYKAPGETESRLIERPITREDLRPAEAEEMREARFAAAVAAFGQILRGGRYTGDFGHDEVIALAEGARGPDPFGYRAEFLTLVRLAKSAAAMERPR